MTSLYRAQARSGNQVSVFCRSDSACGWIRESGWRWGQTGCGDAGRAESAGGWAIGYCIWVR